LNTDLYLIGTIIKSHGIKGEVVVAPWTDRLQRFRALKMILIGRDESSVQRYDIQYARLQPPNVILKFAAVDDRTTADTLRQSQVYVSHEQRIKLPKGKHFIHDVIGLEAVTEDGVRIGTVMDVLLLPAHHVYVVKDNTREMLIPAIKDIVKRIDIKHGKMVVHVIDGLLD
jgi:16S rRNA processing protein RimM